MLTAENRKELVRLLERDYDTTSKLIQSVVGTSFTIRGWAVAAWGGLLGIAADQSSWEFALFALLAVLGFAVVDAYHASLYGAALAYVRMVETAISAYYRAVIHAETDPDVEHDFEVEIRTFKPGLYRHIPRLTLHEFTHARPQWFFTVFYPSLILIAVAVIVATAS